MTFQYASLTNFDQLSIRAVWRAYSGFHCGRTGARCSFKPASRGVRSAWRVEVDAHVGVVVLTPRVNLDKLCAHLTELAAGPVGVSAAYASLDQTPAALRQARLAYATATPGSRELVRYGWVSRNIR